MNIDILIPKQKNYTEVLALQEELFGKNLLLKTQGKQTKNYLVLCEHEPVFTFGKSGKKEHILVGPGQLNAQIIQTSRGGDITFHGPGQLVAYPILDLDTFSIGIADYIFKLEEVIILTLIHYNIKGERLDGAPGIWIDAQSGRARKIAAIGAKTSRHITMHGLAINVNTDLGWFDKIISCGLPDKGVTSLQKELNREVDMVEFRGKFIEEFERSFTPH